MTFDRKATPDQRLAHVRDLVSALNADGLPIFLGPFSSELGFEVMYWLPFLTKLKSQVKDFDQRAIVITRGGAGCLYTSIASRGIDLYAIRTVTDVRRAALKTQRRTLIQKQVTQTPFEDAVLNDVARAFQTHRPYHVIHPSWMYWACEPYWENVAGLKYLLSLCDYTPIVPPKVPESLKLPPKYVAAKWYGRATFPYPDPDVAGFVKTTTATLAAQVPVVCLETPEAYDDHADIPVVGQNVGTIGAGCPPHENVALQAAVIAGATGFVGTYGGTAQLALRMGKPTICFYKDWGGTAYGHRSLNTWLGLQTGVPFLVGSLSDVFLWGQVTGLPAPAAQPAARQAMVKA